ncbi:uncharacterized protein B0P05DRAFT_465568 [Gilbertella persicaria]|uniref:uncharacterized protein n=1 Tax=Gilbertella persicaria TaxID=101096 RepID=UPI00221F2ADB|nr:uncharacterized protein B0P05DRAFT_465568 [Gilbertella persicaria]KAI8087705.1 hypothetical protein B0P05DRAFT_465568 [Gilbertella persicaria]
MNYKKRRGVSPDLSFAHYQEYINQDVITLNRGSQEPKKNFPKKRSNSNVSSKPSTSSVSSPQVPRPPASISNSSSLSQTSEKNSVKSDGPPLNSNFSDSSSTSSVNNNQALTIQQKPIKGVLFEPPPLRTSEDFANMPTLQALHILRLQMKLGSILGSMTPASLLPTALQRVVPHDIRIDYVPGASIRDRMIIFQDYYDIDECFQYLTQQTVFLGGDVRNSRNWSVGADYSVKFWYLSHLVVDQTYNDCIDAKESQIIAEEFCNMSDTEEMPIYPPQLQQQQQDLAISDINPINFGSILLD